jgi:hypothetical protein
MRRLLGCWSGIVLFVGVLLSFSPRAAFAQWDVEGDAHGTIVAVLVLDWNDPDGGGPLPALKETLIATRGSGFFYSADGMVWIERNNGLDDFDIVAVDRAQLSGEIVAVTADGGVWRSCDKGGSWHDIGGGGSSTSAPLEAGELTSVALVETDGGSTLDILVGSRGEGVFRRRITSRSCPSTGETMTAWCALSGGLEAGTDSDGTTVIDLLALGHEGTLVFAGTAEESYVGGTPQKGNVYSIDLSLSANCDISWSKRFGCAGCPGYPAVSVLSLHVRNVSGTGIEAWAGLDGGWVWKMIGTAGNPTRPCSGWIPTDSASREIRGIDILPAGTGPLGIPYNDQLLLAEDDGVHITDLGNCVSGASLNLLSTGFDGSAVSVKVQPVIDSALPRFVFVGTEGAGLVEVDGLVPVGGAIGALISAGIDDFNARAITFSPSFGLSGSGPWGTLNDRTIFAASEAEGIYKSVDGSSFTRVNGLPNGENWCSASAVVVDRGYAEWGTVDGSSGANLKVFAGTEELGVLRSTDGGLTWEPSNGSGTTALPPDPSIVALAQGSSGVLLAAVSGSGLFRSTDGGASWVALAPVRTTATTEPEREIRAVSVGPHFGFGGLDDPTIVLGTEEGVWISLDAGASWISRSSGLPPEWADVRALALSPNFDGRITTCVPGNECPVAPSCTAQSIWVGLDEGGIWFSSTTGQSWREVGGGVGTIPDSADVSAIAPSPDWPTSGIVFAAAVDDGIWYRIGSGGICPSSGTFFDDGGDSAPIAMTAGTGWSRSSTGGHRAPGVWKTGAYANSLCAKLTSNAFVVGASSMLTFWSKYDIETDWDKGVVEIAAGPTYSTWTRLAVNYPDTSTKVGDACLLGPTPAFSRSQASPAWAEYTASLVAWQGQSVKIRFTLSSNATTGGQGWWIDDIAVNPPTTNWTAFSSKTSFPTDPSDLSILALGLPPVFPAEPRVWAGSAVRKMNRASWTNPPTPNAECGGTTIWCQLTGFLTVPPDIQAVASLADGDSDSTILFAGTRDFGLFASWDSGETWAPWGRGLTPVGGASWAGYPVRSVLAVDVSPLDVGSGTRTVVAGTALHGLFRTPFSNSSTAASWTQASGDTNSDCNPDLLLDAGAVAQVLWDAPTSRFLATSSRDKALGSESCPSMDTGALWQPISASGIADNGLFDIAPSPHPPSRAGSPFSGPPQIFPTRFGIWGASGAGAPSLASKVEVAAPPTPKSSSAVNGIYGWNGTSWTLLPGRSGASLPDSESYYSVAAMIDPTVPGELQQDILAGSSQHLYMSVDDGTSWRQMDAEIHCDDGTSLTSVDARSFVRTISPEGILLAVADQSPRCVSTRQGGIYWSDTGGWSWVDVTANLPVARALDLARGIDSPPTYYAGFGLDGVQSRQMTTYVGRPAVAWSSRVCGGGGLDVRFQDRTAGELPTDTVAWSFGGAGACVSPLVACQSSKTPVWRYSARGSYSVSLTVNRGVDAYPRSGTVTVPQPAWTALDAIRDDGTKLLLSWSHSAGYPWAVSSYEIYGATSPTGTPTMIKCLGSAPCSSALGTSTTLSAAEQGSYSHFKVRLVSATDDCGGEPVW